MAKTIYWYEQISKKKKKKLKLMNNAFFGKAMENARKYRDNKLVATERKRSYLVSEPNYHTAKFFTKD